MARRASENGFTLLEVMMAVGIVTIACLGLVASMGSMLTGDGTSTDTRAAREALRAKVEDMRAADFSTFYGDWNGHTFSVPGLLPRSSGAPHGSVTLLSEAEAKAYLAASGSPGLVDLDYDGVFDEASAPAAGEKAYAVRVSITWGDRAQKTDRSLETTTIIFDTGV